jgi:hypothetical protein
MIGFACVDLNDLMSKGAVVGGLKALIFCSYQDLVRVFGEPRREPQTGEKVDVEWGLKFGDGAVVTIYNYKDGPNYCGVKGTPPERITSWHVGGDRIGPKLIAEAFINARLPAPNISWE